MRLVAGRFKGRVLAAPAGRTTRPTADRVREALFNILAHGDIDIDGISVLDAFAGSGALGFEAMSRGASRVSFIEADGEACAIIAANARKLQIADRVQILRADATRPLRAAAPWGPCQLVLLDPPYAGGLAQPALSALAGAGWIARDAIIVVELGAAEPFAAPPPGIAVFDERRYGAARLVLARNTG